MRTIKLLLVLAPFALAAACGGKKPDMADPNMPSTPDLDAGGLPSLDSSAPSMDTPTTPTTPSTDMAMDSGAAMPTTPAAPMDAGGPPDAGKKGGGKGGGKKKK